MKKSRRRTPNRAAKYAVPTLVAAVVGVGVVATLTQPGSAATGPTLSPAKQAVVDAQNTPRVRDKTVTAKTKAAAAVAAAPTSDTWPAGVFADTEAPAPWGMFHGSNRWVGTVGPVTYAVYAGAAGEDTSVGRLLIDTAAGDWTVAKEDSIDVPGAGSLTVLSASGSHIVLIGGDGMQHVLTLPSEAVS